MIILIGGEKGGTGKTTITTNLAVNLLYRGVDVLVIDTDKQGSASAWCASRDYTDKARIPWVQLDGSVIHHQIKDLAKRYEYVIIDAGGRDSVELRSAMGAADILIIPIQASQLDVWTLGSMNDMVRDARIFNPNLIAKIIINRASPNPAVNEVEEAKSIIGDFDEIKLSNIVVRDRIAFRKAAKSGLGVVELADEDKKAIGEIEELYKEIFGK